MNRPPRTDLERREFLRIGQTSFSSLTLGQLLQLRSGVAEAPANLVPERTAIILVWLRGGASHLETFDCKLLASSDFRRTSRPDRRPQRRDSGVGRIA